MFRKTAGFDYQRRGGGRHRLLVAKALGVGFVLLLAAGASLGLSRGSAEAAVYDGGYGGQAIISPDIYGPGCGSSNVIYNPVPGPYGYFMPTGIYAPSYFNFFPCLSNCDSQNSVYGAVYSVFTPLCPGPPAAITTFPAPDTMHCGGFANITVKVTDYNGFSVRDGTDVTFSTDLGYIGTTASTDGGVAVASLTIPTHTSGNADITITSGGVTNYKTVLTYC